MNALTPQTDTRPFFCIIIPTRNRPEKVRDALRSVSRQTFRDREVLVIIDGSTDADLANYQTVEQEFPDARFIRLVHRPNGHGQSYSMNFGAAHTSADFLCFLDDDDIWTDDDYLQNCHDNIQASTAPVDVHYSNQRAFYCDNTPQNQPLWLEDLISRLPDTWHLHGNCYRVQPEFLINNRGFAHLNCSVFRREFYHAIGGMDESIRYENDRDVFIRSLDAAALILFTTDFVSRHNIPDIAKRESMSTASSAIEKKIYQLRVYDKAISTCMRPEIVKVCRQSKSYELKHLSRILASQQRHTSAAYFAREALLVGFNLRWLAYTLYLSGVSLVTGNRGA